MNRFAKILKYICYILIILNMFLSIKTHVHAEEIVQTSYFDSSVNNNYQGSITYQHTTYTATPLNQNGSLKHLFENVGNGYINFTLYVDNGASGTNQLYEITLNGSNNSVYQCNFNLNMYKDNTSQTGLTSVQCPVALTNSYINRITLKRTDIWGTTNIVFSNLWSFTTSKDASNTIQEQINANLNIIGQEIRNNGAKLDNISTILSTLTTNSTNTINAINNQTQQQHQDSQNTQQKIDDVNNTMKDDSVDNNQADSFFNDFQNADTGSLMDLVGLPLEFLDSLYDTCQPFTITIPFIDNTITIPCMSTIYNDIGSIIDVVKILINGFICYYILKRFIEFIQELKDPNNDDIEVMDL